MQKTLIIGIDGGATKVSGWRVSEDENGKFSITDENVQHAYREYPAYMAEFTPVNIKTQLAEMNASIHLTDAEIVQGSVYTRCAADVIVDLLRKHPDSKALVGIGMPGLKSSDKRGIVALANGPRMPLYAAHIEKIIDDSGLTLQAPIHHLGSDADYCGLGEEYSVDGLFGDVDTAYYLGGGTGVADAMKLQGRVTPFDLMKDWMAKAWEMKGDRDLSMERYASAAGIQHIYSLISGKEISGLNESGLYPPQILDMAVKGDKEAAECMDAVAMNIAKLLFERMNTLYSGWQDDFEFVNPAKARPDSSHPYRGTLLQRIILGQRLSDLMKEAAKGELLWKPMVTKLEKLVRHHKDKKFRNYYLQDGVLKQDLIQFSRLREAPAIGAGVDAVLSERNK